MTNRLLAMTLAGVVGVTGCARESVLLLPGENGAPVGSVAVLERSGGGDAAVLAQENQIARLSAGRVSQRTLKPGTVSSRDLRLVEDLPPPPRTFTLNFLTDSTALTPESEPVLRELFAEVRKRDGVDVLVVGHTDRAGGEDRNDALSLERARDIRAQLIARGLDPASTRAVGRGERDMAVTTADGVSSLANRRVEVIVR
jgi:outer membrane protein OmpA-like peptidoglycan-associated protein